MGEKELGGACKRREKMNTTHLYDVEVGCGRGWNGVEGVVEKLKPSVSKSVEG